MSIKQKNMSKWQMAIFITSKIMSKSNVHNIKNDVHTDQKKRSEKWEFNNLSKEIIKYENAL